MIPLAHWLTERAEAARSSESGPILEEYRQLDEVICPESPPANDTEAPNREEELLEALLNAEQRIEELSLTHAGKEKELLNRIGDELTSRIAAEMGRALDDVLSNLEETVGDVLRPFLCDQARARAVSSLLELVREELQQTDNPVLEIRAPVDMHEALLALRQSGDVSSMLTESRTVEIVRATNRIRFEELSLLWCQAIEGNNT